MAEQEPGAMALPEEERARAQAYALLGRLFYAAPDEGLLAEIRAQDTGADAGDDAVSAAWRRLIQAAAVSQPAALVDEHETLFGGVGKALVTPYTSHYVEDAAPDKHLVALREALAELGMTRRSVTGEIEDHCAAIFEAMRLLIERDQPLEMQKAFFTRFVLAGMLPLCAAIEAVEAARFYRAVARLARAYVELEAAAFDMVDG